MFKIKIYYEDTDAGGIVYYANYLKYLERARSHLLIDKGFNHTNLKENFDLLIIVKSCNIEYVKSAKLEDEISIKTIVIKKTRAQILLDQKIYRNKELLVDAKVKLVSVNSMGKVTKMPIELYKIF